MWSSVKKLPLIYVVEHLFIWALVQQTEFIQKPETSMLVRSISKEPHLKYAVSLNFPPKMTLLYTFNTPLPYISSLVIL